MPVEPREVFERYVEVLNRQDWGELDNLLHADYVEEYPQSGERIRGIANIKALMSNYPGAEAIAGNVANVDVVGGEAEWLVTPAFTVVRVEGSGDVFTGVARSRYPDGSLWHVVALLKMRDGKIWRSTTFFAQAFPAPEWRSQWVEPIEPGTG